MVSPRVLSKHYFGPDSDGFDGHSDRVFVQNASKIGSTNQYFATSGFSVGSGSYVELTAGITDRSSILVYNYSEIVLFIGTSGAGPTNMLPVSGVGTSISLAVGSGIKIYGIASADSADTRVVELG